MGVTPSRLGPGVPIFSLKPFHGPAGHFQLRFASLTGPKKIVVSKTRRANRFCTHHFWFFCFPIGQFEQIFKLFVGQPKNKQKNKKTEKQKNKKTKKQKNKKTKKKK